MKTIVGTGLVAAALSALACGQSVIGPGDLTGGTWRLQSLQRADRSVVNPPAGPFTLRFAEERRLEIRADCNGCGGTFRLDGSALAVSQVFCTRAFCPSAPFDIDYVKLVEAATTVERTDDVLILRSPAGVLRFVR